MYVVKVGDFYVKSVEIYGNVVTTVELSKELMRSFSEKWGKVVARVLCAELIEIKEEVTNEESQMSIYDYIEED